MSFTYHLHDFLFIYRQVKFVMTIINSEVISKECLISRNTPEINMKF